MKEKKFKKEICCRIFRLDQIPKHLRQQKDLNINDYMPFTTLEYCYIPKAINFYSNKLGLHLQSWHEFDYVDQ
jgi:hypothetical protein